MNRLMHILAGSAVTGALAYFGLGRALHWYEMNRARSEHDLSNALVTAMAVLIVVIVAGGWIGGWVHRRRSASRRSIP